MPMEPIHPSKALVLMARPEMQADNARRVRRGFWRKLRRYAGYVPFSDEALAAFYCAGDRQTPAQVRAILLAALAYFVLPTDLVPDILAGVGFGDDAAVFWAAWSMVDRHIRPEHRDRARAWFEELAEEAPPAAPIPPASSTASAPASEAIEAKPATGRRFWRLMRRA